MERVATEINEITTKEKKKNVKGGNRVRVELHRAKDRRAQDNDKIRDSSKLKGDSERK